MDTKRRGDWYGFVPDRPLSQPHEAGSGAGIVYTQNEEIVKHLPYRGLNRALEVPVYW